MKIRNGFVSNSSSSSFVVKLNKDIDDYKDYREFASDYDIPQEKDVYGRVLYDDLKLLSKQHQFELLDDISVTIENTYEVDLDMWDDVMEITEKLKRAAKDLFKQKLIAKYKNNTRTVTYSDDSEFEKYMEQKFMPKFKGTIEVISEH